MLLQPQFQSLVPAPDGGDDFIRIGRPAEGSWSVVGLGDEAFDGGLEIDERSEDAPLEPSLGELGKEALDGVKPAGGGGRKVEHEARMTAEPAPTLGCL